jgi:hypothetical protein
LSVRKKRLRGNLYLTSFHLYIRIICASTRCLRKSKHLRRHLIIHWLRLRYHEWRTLQCLWLHHSRNWNGLYRLLWKHLLLRRPNELHVGKNREQTMRVFQTLFCVVFSQSQIRSYKCEPVN